MVSINVLQARLFAAKLMELGRSAYPVAIRSSINSVAFDLKQNTLQKHADLNFVKRSPNFFKANSKVLPAQGFDLTTMKATVGMIESRLSGSSNYSVKDLEQQDRGGNIKSKAYIPISTARSGKNKNKNVQSANRLSGINRIVDARKVSGVSDRQRFVKAVHIAGTGGYVLSKWHEKVILWRVNSLTKTSKGSFKLTPLYTYEHGRTVHVQATHFMKNASFESHKKLPDYFIAEAKKQITKALNK